MTTSHRCGDAMDQINFVQHLFDVNPFLGQGYFSRKLYDNIKMTKPSEGLRRPRLRAPSCARLSFLKPNAPSAESLLICHTIIFHHTTANCVTKSGQKGGTEGPSWKRKWQIEASPPWSKCRVSSRGQTLPPKPKWLL